MTAKTRAPRTLLLVGVAAMAIVLSTGGCSWLRGNKSDYKDSREANPLEVPPDLDRPDTSSATALPVASSASPPPSTGSDRLALPASEAFPKVGEALASIPGAIVNGRTEALSSYDVTYNGESFLVRVLEVSGGSRLVALSADGRMLNTGAAAQLMTAIKAKLR
jgi:uncharacterized lipoprotein